ncbi:DUF4157 domain-containing protein [Massilia sp. DJPM01]|uniref:eCIS core domain-containing protein n=1 Tax=Massilia sp. DJPM01 TaxID=3024404 RepID=UPI00259EF9D1|nr:DUF4157 domain-containing protein [Massilia sp. DJPM01]MDM5178922.1 DUF4157 domain-containing protein [Massilia sp. DJPM01]
MQAPLQSRDDSDAVQTKTASTATQERMFVDDRPAAVAQRKLADMMNNSPHVLQQRALGAAIQNSPQLAAQRHKINALFSGTVQRHEHDSIPAQLSPVQRDEKSNNGGLPYKLMSGIESLSDMSMDHVKVHYNSDKPAQMQAHAYAQGSEIHVGPGQERHLPHEAWHIVQQAQGRVLPTLQMKAGAVNDDPSLEKDAGMMGEKAAQFESDHGARPLLAEERVAGGVTQRFVGSPQTANDSPHVSRNRFLAEMMCNIPRVAQAKTSSDQFQRAGIVQRRILLNSEPLASLSDLGYLPNTPEHQILSTWNAAEVDHDFAGDDILDAAQTLAKAIRRAGEVDGDEEGKYKAENLRFFTKEPGEEGGDRLPTLYFKESHGGWSGRIRQQHGSGPLIKSQLYKMDYFFDTSELMHIFKNAMSKLRHDLTKDVAALGETEEDKLKREDLEETCRDNVYKLKAGVKTDPYQGAAHCEITYLSGLIVNTHASAGLTHVDLGEYDDEKIGDIYSAVIGRE